MGPLDFLNHVLNFAAPALVVGVLLPLMAKVAFRRARRVTTLRAQMVLNSAVGLVALTGGVIVFGRDGKMASYAALVFACAASQWWAMRR